MPLLHIFRNVMESTEDIEAGLGVVIIAMVEDEVTLTVVWADGMEVHLHPGLRVDVAASCKCLV
jgi:hypothetical protein